MTIELLRNECRKYGLRVSGTYKELKERLKEYKIENDITSSSKPSKLEIHGRNIGADILVSYGSTDIIGYYKKYGINYDRPSYIKIDDTGNIIQNGKIYIYYKAQLDECGNYNNSMFKGTWIIGKNQFNYSLAYYNIAEDNDSYSVPLTGWEDEINILIL